MKVILALALCASLSGCFYQTVDQQDLKYAIKQCGGVEKIDNIQPWFAARVDVKCENKKSQLLNREGGGNEN